MQDAVKYVLICCLLSEVNVALRLLHLKVSTDRSD
jgi:hypothetical protein